MKTMEDIQKSVQDGVIIKALDEDRVLIVNGVVGIHPSVGFNFSADYTTAAGIDGKTLQPCFANRGFLYSDYNKTWALSETN